VHVLPLLGYGLNISFYDIFSFERSNNNNTSIFRVLKKLLEEQFAFHDMTPTCVNSFRKMNMFIHEKYQNKISFFFNDKKKVRL